MDKIAAVRTRLKREECKTLIRECQSCGMTVAS